MTVVNLFYIVEQSTLEVGHYVSERSLHMVSVIYSIYSTLNMQ